MRPRVRELFGAEKIAAADLVRTWGYPREVDVYELVTGHWFEYGPGLAIFWIVSGGDHQGPGEAAFHVRAYPGRLAALRFRHFLGLLPVLGDLLGLSCYRVKLLEPRIGNLLATCGWTEADGRWYLSLEG